MKVPEDKLEKYINVEEKAVNALIDFKKN